MRDTLIGLVILLTVAGIYIHSRRNQSEVGPVPSLKASSLLAHKKLVRKNKQKHSIEGKFNKIVKGDIHESTDHRSREQVQLYGTDSRASKSVEQTERVTSIYQDEEPEASPAVNTAELESTLGEMGNSEDSPTLIDSIPTSRATMVSKSVLGVPLSSWIKSQRNRLASRPQVADLSGFHFYFNCMELKSKELKSLSERDCEAITGQLSNRAELPIRNTY